jgi:hypothetical protein
MLAPLPPREMVVFISYENQVSPEQTAREMVQALNIGRAEYGLDLFTGGCEVRTGFDRSLLEEIIYWLRARQVIFDLNYLY